jgi:hypothetical protein
MKLMQLVTGDDNSTLEPAYALSTLAVVIGLGLAVASFITGKPFDIQAYGIGAGSLLTGLGLSAKFGK